MILSLFVLFIFIIFIIVGYLLLTDFHIEIDNEKTEENIS